MRGLAGPGLVLTLLLAGCVSTSSPPVGLTKLPSIAVPSFSLPVAVSRDLPGSEPVIAVAGDGTLFVQGVGGANLPTSALDPLPAAAKRASVNSVWRSRDAGATWEDVTPPGLAQQGSRDGFVAIGNGDSVYLQNSAELTFQLFRSDDEGIRWQMLPTPKLPIMHRSWIVPVGVSTVHVVMEAFPPAFGSYLAGQAPPADVSVPPNEGLWYMRSDDKGMTWSLPAQIDPNVNFAGQGNLVVSADGQRLYVPRYHDAASRLEPTYQKGDWYLLASEDGGKSWKSRPMFALTSDLASAVEPLAMDDAGTLYFGWAQEQAGTSQALLSYSKDGGTSWSSPRAIGPNQAVTQAMLWIAAREPGQLAAMWYQADVHGTAAKVDAPWFIQAARIAAADTPEPRIALNRVTPEPVHEGNICAKGPACQAGEDRRLADYPWVVFGPKGEAEMVFASTAWDKPSAFAVALHEAV